MRAGISIRSARSPSSRRPGRRPRRPRPATSRRSAQRSATGISGSTGRGRLHRLRQLVVRRRILGSARFSEALGVTVSAVGRRRHPGTHRRRRCRRAARCCSSRSPDPATVRKAAAPWTCCSSADPTPLISSITCCADGRLATRYAVSRGSDDCAGPGDLRSQPGDDQQLHEPGAGRARAGLLDTLADFAQSPDRMAATRAARC